MKTENGLKAFVGEYCRSRSTCSDRSRYAAKRQALPYIKRVIISPSTRRHSG
jgi:hypothetical protein